MIVIRNLTKRFGDQLAVDAVSFEVGARQTLVLLGTSGSGKTTTLKMINRLIEPTDGLIEVNGSDIRQRRDYELRREIGYVIQDSGLFPHYTIGENIATVPQLLGWDAPTIRRRTDELMAMLRLPAKTLSQYPGQLSGGQRQRVGLARALAARPTVLLMDEPLGALDPVTRLGIRREFLSLEEWQQKTIVLVTHDIGEAFELGDRIGLMDGGRLQQIGTPKDLLLRPANAFVRRFFDDQRFILQLQAFTLADLASHMTATPTAPDPDSSELSSGTSLANALEGVARGQQAFFRHRDTCIRIQPADLMAALSQLVNGGPA